MQEPSRRLRLRQPPVLLAIATLLGTGAASAQTAAGGAALPTVTVTSDWLGAPTPAARASTRAPAPS